MRRITLFILLTSFSFFLTAQNSNLKKAILQLSDNVYEIIETKKQDTIIIGTLSSVEPEIKNGDFKFYYEDGSLQTEGSYIQNYPSGIWTYYDKNGNILKEVDYGRAIQFLIGDTLVKTEDTFFVVEDMPKFEGKSSDNFRLYIQKSLVYPIYALHKGAQGRVFIQMTINEKGDVCNVKVVRGAEYLDLNMEAIRVVSESPKWTPGKQRGKEIPVTYTFPIVFQL